MSAGGGAEPRTHECEFAIPAEHPALPGHFPGRPVVPGVVIVDSVVAAAELWLARPLAVRGLPQVKFAGVLEPDRRARVRLAWTPGSLRFEVESDGRTIAQGACTLAERVA